MQNIELKLYTPTSLEPIQPIEEIEEIEEIMVEVDLGEPLIMPKKTNKSSLIRNIVLWGLFCNCLVGMYLIIVFSLIYIPK